MGHGREIGMRAPQTVRQDLPPIFSVHDSPRMTDRGPGQAYALGDIYIEEPGRLRSRPAFTYMDPQYSTNPSLPVIQGLWHWEFDDSAFFPHGHAFLAVVDGAVYEYSTAGFEEFISTASMVLNSVNLSTAVDVVYAVQFANGIVFSDGINTPWHYDVGSGAITNLNNCPILYGQPEVYYSKLFGIKSTERDTMVWSEEAQPNLGYEAGGYNNSWTLQQSGSGRLYRLLGTNEALYYFRNDGIGTVRGAVTPAFRAAGSHEDVSQEVGTRYPRSVIHAEDFIYWLNEHSRPYRMRVGGKPEPLWGPLREALADVVTTGPEERYFVGYNPELDLVHFSCPTDDEYSSRLFNFGAMTGHYLGYWEPPFTGSVRHMTPAVRAEASTTEPPGPREFFVANSADFGFLESMYSTVQADSISTNDTFDQVIEALIETGPMFFDEQGAFIFDRLDIYQEYLGDVHNLVVSVITDEGETTQLAFSPSTHEDVNTIGLDAWGNYARIRLHIEQTGDSSSGAGLLSVNGMRLTAIPDEFARVK